MTPASPRLLVVDDHRKIREPLATRAGTSAVYRVGGPAVIGALAYGTESIRPVDVIVGPGSARPATMSSPPILA